MSKKPFLTLREIVVFAMLGALMVCSKLLMELAPNIHLLGAFVITFTLVYRVKALLPIYLYVVLLGLFYGFPYQWWGAHLYLWTVLWGATMLLPKKLPPKLAPVIYMVLCGLHGLLYGVLFAPYNSLVFGYNFSQTLAWIAAGFWFDFLHMLGNIAAGVLIVPMQKLLLRLEKNRRH